MPPIFISAIIVGSGGKFLNLAHYFPYDITLRLLPHSRSFLANQITRNAIVGAENLLRACLHGGGGPQVGEVTRLGGVTRLSI